MLPADLYFRAAAAATRRYLAPELQARIAALPGVRRAEFLREQQLLLDPARPRVVLLARAVDRGRRRAQPAARRYAVGRRRRMRRRRCG